MKIPRVVSNHPLLTLALVLLTLAGIGLGYVFLPAEWSALRRLLGGAVAGAGVWLLIYATRMGGAWEES